MNTRKTVLVAAALALSAVAQVSHAVPIYSDTFQGLTFTFEQTDADTLSFNIAGTPGGDWTGVQYLGAFDLKDLGLDFKTDTGTANGPGAVNLLGKNSQLSASNTNCSKTTGQAGSVCFDLSPDVALGGLPMNFTYIIDFSAPLNISSAGPHLQIVFTDTAGGAKVGSLYSTNVPMRVPVSEPSSSTLLVLGLVFLIVGKWTARPRRRLSIAS